AKASRAVPKRAAAAKKAPAKAGGRATAKQTARKAPAAGKAAARGKAIASSRKFVTIGDVSLEVERRGRGKPLLVFYGEEAIELDSPVLDKLARRYELIIPSPPGFGRSNRPDWITNTDDMAYLYLDL